APLFRSMTTRISDAGASGLVRPRQEEDRDVFRSMQWMAVLRALEAYQMYRRHIRRRISGEHALRFLLQDDGFPRSVYFCIVRAQRTLPSMPPRPAVERQINRIVGLIRNADPASLAERNPADFVDGTQVSLGRLHNVLTEAYFRA